MKTAKHASYAAHLAAYAWAAPFIFRKSVVDIGCGEGHGLALLSLFAHQVKGIDISTKSLSLAQKRQYACPATFEAVDLDSLPPFEPDSCIVAFEVLEHIKNPKAFIEHIKHLPLIFSVPHCYPHPLHLTNFTSLAEVEELVHPHYASYEWYQMDYQGLISPGAPIQAPPSSRKDRRSLYRYLGVCLPHPQD